MRFRVCAGVDPAATGVSFFSACLDEALYEYTPASYKPRVMGVRSLALEAKSVIARVEAGAMDRARLYPILEELEDRLQGNSVAKELLLFPVSYYTSYDKDEDLKSIRVRLGLLRNSLGDERYRSALQHEAIRLCQSDREKLAIREIARSWASAIGSIGFSRQFMHEVVVGEFFTDGIKYSSANELTKFFNKFTGDRLDFEAIVCAGKVITELSDTIEKFWCALVGPDENCEEIAACGLRPTVNDRLVRVKKISARDKYSARDIAEKRLERISDLFAIFHHKSRIKWQPEIIVQQVGGERSLVDARPSSLARSRDNFPKKASQKLARHIGGLNFSDKDSLGRFISVVRLHGAAQEAASPQAQIVNLWTAMEVLVSRESESKLRGVRKCIIPFLVYGYFDRLLYYLAGDLYRWKRRQVSEVIRKAGIHEWSQHQKVAAILLGGELESVRDELYSLLDGFPLLRNRCFQFSELISDASRLEKAMKAHEQRVSWQIERIYRARNTIVHDGSAPPHVDALTENAHEYLDSFIDRFFVLCSRLKVVTTLDEAIAFQTRLYEDWKKNLASAKGAKVDRATLHSFCALDAHERHVA